MFRQVCKLYFCQVLRQIPRIDLKGFLYQQPSYEDCVLVAEGMRKYGCVIVKDPRVSEEKNRAFLSCMKRYFMKRQEQLDRGEALDIFKELSYEIGLSPPGIMMLDDYSGKLDHYREENKPQTPFPPQPIRALRYFWNIGGMGKELQNRPPADFPEMKSLLDDWGHCTFESCVTLASMLQIGLNLPKGSFSSLLRGGANKLAPIGADLTRMRPGEAFVGFHQDYGFLTIHGRSTYPGLSIWLPTGEKVKVRTPEGYLLVQAGSELEYLTGGYIKCGMHEAINTREVQELAKKQKENGSHPWRITSTVFTHLRADTILKPIGRFASDQACTKYPAVLLQNFMLGYLKKRQL